jgi:hypothetical protein
MIALQQSLARAVTHVTWEYLHAEPEKVSPGMVVLADGTDWDPGSGIGFYRRSDDNATWDYMEGASAFLALAAHLADTVDAHDASAISILDAAGDFTATEVEGALAELQSDHEADAQALVDHVAAADPHPVYLTAAEGNAAYQPLDADLTAIAAVATTAYGRSLLALSNATALAGEVDAFFLTPAEGNAAYQPLDSTLTAFAAYNTNGLLTQTAADTFTGRTITGTAGQITLTNGNGVGGNPVVSLPADVLIPTVLTVPFDGLHLLDSDASHDLIIRPGTNLSADRTLAIVTGDTNRVLTFTGDASISGTNTGDQTSVTGNAGTVTVANEAADTTCFPLFATAASGSLEPKTNAGLTFNASTGVITLASSVLTTTDINGGTVDGAVVGGASASAGTFTTLTATGQVVISGAGAGQIVFPATKNASANANTLDDYQEGSFTGTGTGFTTSPTCTIYYTIVGNSVTMDISGAGISATSNATTFTITGMPAEARPASTKIVLVRTKNNGAAFVISPAQIDSAGTITLFNGPDAGSFTNSGTKACPAQSFAYTLV